VCVCSSAPGQRFHRHITWTSFFPAQSHSRSTVSARHQISGRFKNPVLKSSGDLLKVSNANINKRILSRVDCFLTSDPASRGWLKPRRWQNFTSTTWEGACVHPEYRLPIRKRADCKAGQYEITGSPFSPSDGPHSALLMVLMQFWLAIRAIFLPGGSSSQSDGPSSSSASLRSSSAIFFRDRAWARISLRRDESGLQDKDWFQRRETNPHKAKDYTAPKARPDDRPRATTSGSRRRKPA